MRGLPVGVTVAIALIVGALTVAAAHAEEPDTPQGEALAELVFAGAAPGSAGGHGSTSTRRSGLSRLVGSFLFYRRVPCRASGRASLRVRTTATRDRSSGRP
jgi:hypothetical protein